MVGVVILPQEFITKLKNKIQPEHKASFIAALVVGLIAHLYKLTNWLPNWDSLVFRYDSQNMIAIGRWFLPVASAPSSYYDLPWLTGLIAILFFSLGAVCVCQLFGVRSRITATLIGAVVASFPTVTSVLAYNYVADAYALSFLLACIAPLLITDKKPRYVTAAVLIALSVGIYQAYVTTTIMLLLCYLITGIMRRSMSVRELLISSLRYLATGAAGMLLYYLVLSVILKITGTQMLEYQGVDSALSLSSIDILGALYTIKESFILFFFDFSSGISTFCIINCVLFSLIVIFYLVDILRGRMDISRIVLLLLFVLFLPIGASVLALINSTVDYHNLMKMGFFVFYLIFLLCYERDDSNSERFRVIRCWSILIVGALLVFNQIVIANVSYHKLTMAYENSYGTLIRIADRIEQTDGADACDSILVIGALDDSDAYSVVLPPDMTGMTDGYIIRADDEIVGQSVLCSALNDYTHKNYAFLAGEEKKELLAKIDESSMDKWPSKDSIIVVDNVIVIKLGDAR